MARKSFAIPGQWLQVAATVLFAAALTVLMMIGIRRADELQSASAVLQLASELSSRPQIIRSELTLMQRGLEATTFVGEPLRSLAGIRQDSSRAFAQMQQQLRAGALDGGAIAAPLAAAFSRWQVLDRELAVLSRKPGGDLYADTASGSELTSSGRRLKAAVDGLLATQGQNLQVMGDQLRQLSAILRGTVTNEGRSLRSLLLGGTAVAALLLGMMLYYAWRSRQFSAAAAGAQRQVLNILNTVREGLFLVDRELNLGDTCSDSLTELLRTPAPAGRSFEEVLKPLVDDKTLVAALKFLNLLWNDRVNEELIESVNPLNQVEVSLLNVHGSSDVRYLAFSFRRVRGEQVSGDYLLGVVADVTDRVLLAREIEQVKSEGDSQATLLLQLLRVDPAQLEAFLGTADVALRKSNALLTASGIGQVELKGKVNGVFRELHAIKGEASALSLANFVQHIHAIEDTLTLLRSQTTLSGNDFLPVVVKLDELMTEVASVHSLQDRIAAYRPKNAALAAQSDDESLTDTTVIDQTLAAQTLAAPTAATQAVAVQAVPTAVTAPAPATAAAAAAAPGVALQDTLRSLLEEVAAAHSRSARLVTRGLEDVPQHYMATVKDICIQMVRNSVVHGIESAPKRVEQRKTGEGTVLISFAMDSVDDYLLTIEDDGRGLSYEQILDQALRQGLVQPRQAATLDRTSALRLIFQPGFSTAETVSEHAGRGVGLDAVSHLVRESGGKIGVATAVGQYTRFKVLLPKAIAGESTAASSAA